MLLNDTGNRSHIGCLAVSILSLIRGFPLFAGHSGCFGWEVANQNFNDIENPKMPNREQFLYNLAYAQWSPQEFADGTVWKRFREQL